VENPGAAGTGVGKGICLREGKGAFCDEFSDFQVEPDVIRKDGFIRDQKQKGQEKNE
jgi:hypothetical protein